MGTMTTIDDETQILWLWVVRLDSGRPTAGAALWAGWTYWIEELDEPPGTFGLFELTDDELELESRAPSIESQVHWQRASQADAALPTLAR